MLFIVNDICIKYFHDEKKVTFKFACIFSVQVKYY